MPTILPSKYDMALEEVKKRLEFNRAATFLCTRVKELMHVEATRRNTFNQEHGSVIPRKLVPELFTPMHFLDIDPACHQAKLSEQEKTDAIKSIAIQFFTELSISRPTKSQDEVVRTQL